MTIMNTAASPALTAAAWSYVRAEAMPLRCLEMIVVVRLSRDARQGKYNKQHYRDKPEDCDPAGHGQPCCPVKFDHLRSSGSLPPLASIAFKIASWSHSLKAAEPGLEPPS